MTDKKEKLVCCICGYEFKKLNDIGLRIIFDEKNPEYKRIKQMFGKTEFYVCWICGLKAVGIKEVNVK